MGTEDDLAWLTEELAQLRPAALPPTLAATLTDALAADDGDIAQELAALKPLPLPRTMTRRLLRQLREQPAPGGSRCW